MRKPKVRIEQRERLASVVEEARIAKVRRDPQDEYKASRERAFERTTSPIPLFLVAN